MPNLSGLSYINPYRSRIRQPPSGVAYKKARRSEASTQHRLHKPQEVFAVAKKLPGQIDALVDVPFIQELSDRDLREHGYFMCRSFQLPCGCFAFRLPTNFQGQHHFLFS